MVSMSFGARLKHAWNAFRGTDPPFGRIQDYGMSQWHNPNQSFLRIGTERTILSAILNRIAIDVASSDFRHVRLGENGRYEETLKTGLNECLSVSANIDQTGRAFILDVALSLFDEGCVAIVPVDTTVDPKVSSSYEINSLRTGRITEWFPKHVRVELYNDNSGQKEEIVLPKETVAIVENPFYEVMNGPNSTLQRLVRKLNLLDVIDDQIGSGKIDIIIQLPYVIRSEAKRNEAEARRKAIEEQLVNSKYGIAYADAAEKITQLNRPVENNMLSQVEYLTSMLYSQLSMNEEILKGTADENTMSNYLNRTVAVVDTAIAEAMKRTFLTKTARTQGQSIMFFRDPFKMIPPTELAEVADKLTRNEILSSNEVRAIVGYKPDADPRADELRNSNIAAGNDQLPKSVTSDDKQVMNDERKESRQNGSKV